MVIKFGYLKVKATFHQVCTNRHIGLVVIWQFTVLSVLWTSLLKQGDVLSSQFYSSVPAFGRSRTKIHRHMKHTITRTNWLSLLLTLTLSICLPMTVGLSSTLWCSLFLWVCLPKWSVRLSPSVSAGTNVNARNVCLSVSKRLWIWVWTHCLHVLFVHVDVWVSVVLCFFYTSIFSVSVFVMKDKWTVDSL